MFEGELMRADARRMRLEVQRTRVQLEKLRMELNAQRQRLGLKATDSRYQHTSGPDVSE
jgi:hypothetical protein